MAVSIEMSRRRVLVTGAAGGLGAATAVRLAECGADLALADLSEAGLAKLADALPGKVVTLPGDLADPETARSLPARAADLLGGLDGLVNCAGVMHTKPFAELAAQEWQRVVEVNLNAVFHVTQQSANLMRERGGSIVTLASVAARSGRPNAPHYAAAKAALLSLTKSAALAYGPKVRVNAVCPGVFLTDMWRDIIAERDDRFGPGAGETYLAEVTGESALRRAGDPEELANVVAFLLSDIASYVTGQAVNVDGGLEMH